MELKDALRPGMRVIGSDHRDYGPVERFDNHALFVRGQQVPFSAIERLEQDRLFIRTQGIGGRQPTPTASDERSAEMTDPSTFGQGTRIPIVEEQLQVGARVVDLGEILVHKSVDVTEEVRRGPLSWEDVEVERVQVNRPVDEPEERRQEGDTLIIPIMEEVFVVQKQLMVKEEIRIRKQLITEETEVRELIRRERATIEDTRPAPAARHTRQPQAPDRDDDDASWESLRQEISESGR